MANSKGQIAREFTKEIRSILRRGDIGVLLTDTIYGVVGSALSKKTVERIYKLKSRNERKPLIVLIASAGDLKKFGVKFAAKELQLARRLWREKPTSIILPAPGKKFAYLHRGTNSIAFRMPAFAPASAGKARMPLLRLLRTTGPLVAPSANPEGKHPATTIKEAMTYFGGRVDFYMDGGRKKGMPSRLIAFKNGESKVLR